MDDHACAECEAIVCEAMRGLPLALALLAAIERIGADAFVAAARYREPSKHEFT